MTSDRTTRVQRMSTTRRVRRSGCARLTHSLWACFAHSEPMTAAENFTVIDAGSVQPGHTPLLLDGAMFCDLSLHGALTPYRHGFSIDMELVPFEKQVVVLQATVPIIGGGFPKECHSVPTSNNQCYMPIINLCVRAWHTTFASGSLPEAPVFSQM